MSSITDHKKHITEHLEVLQDAVNVGIVNRKVTVGLHTSACASELLEMYLHLAGLISSGKQVEHEWFKRPHKGQKVEPWIERKLPVNFPDKEKIYEFAYTIEENRNALVYGKGTESQAKLVLENFNSLKEALKQKIEERGEKIE